MRFGEYIRSNLIYHHRESDHNLTASPPGNDKMDQLVATGMVDWNEQCCLRACIMTCSGSCTTINEYKISQ